METDASRTKCPFSYLWQGSEQHDKEEPCSTSASQKMDDMKGQCPLGFGGSKGKSKMSMIHCILCTSIMYKASTTNCGHTYCQSCIERFRDCPTCGADIVEVTHNAAVDQAIEDFLQAHAGTIHFWDLEEEDISRIIERAKNAPEKPEFEKAQDTATFYVHAGMRAMSGGNVSNAVHWFDRSKGILEGCMPVESSKKRMEILSSLGSVYGAIGDCHKATGDLEHALKWYQKSIDTLTSATALEGNGVETSDPFHALSITINKVGEMYHRQGDVAQALDMYTRALKVRGDRFEACDDTIPAERRMTMMIDIAISQAKVADAMRICGYDEDARRLNAETVQLVQSVDITQCHSASTHAKYRRLKEHLENI